MSKTRFVTVWFVLVCCCLLIVIACRSDAQSTYPTTPNTLAFTSIVATRTPLVLASLSPIADMTTTDAMTSSQRVGNLLENHPYPPGTTIADIDVGGLTRADASHKLRLELSPIERPLQLYVGTTHYTITASDIHLTFYIEGMLDQTDAQLQHPTRQGKPVHIPLHITFDHAALRHHISRFAHQTTIAPNLHVLTDTVVITSFRSVNNEIAAPYFTYTPGYTLNIEDTIADITERLYNPRASHHIELMLEEDTNAALPYPDEHMLQQQVAFVADQWQEGIIGYYQYDLQHHVAVGFHENTVFSGASVMKAAILLHAYVSLPYFTEIQQEWINEMIKVSSNIAANYVLATSIGGASEYAAQNATQHMTSMLQKLGLEHTYQKGPYIITSPQLASMSFAMLYPVSTNSPEEAPPPTPELYDMGDVTPTSYTYLTQEGVEPYTEADFYLRTSPYEMSQIFLLIDQCSKGKGTLLALFSKTLDAGRCQEMLDILALNEDTMRMRAGLPTDLRVEHKSGWIDDMQADVGIVRSPGGNFVLAIFLYQEYFLEDDVAHPLLAILTRLTYSAYNPIKYTAGSTMR